MPSKTRIQERQRKSIPSWRDTVGVPKYSIFQSSTGWDRLWRKSMHELKSLLNILDEIPKSCNYTVRERTTLAEEEVEKMKTIIRRIKSLIIRMNIERKSKQKKKQYTLKHKILQWDAEDGNERTTIVWMIKKKKAFLNYIKKILHLETGIVLMAIKKKSLFVLLLERTLILRWQVPPSPSATK